MSYEQQILFNAQIKIWDMILIGYIIHKYIIPIKSNLPNLQTNVFKKASLKEDTNLDLDAIHHIYCQIFYIFIEQKHNIFKARNIYFNYMIPSTVIINIIFISNLTDLSFHLKTENQLFLYLPLKVWDF